VSENTILLLDTQKKSEELLKSFSSHDVKVENISNSTLMAQHLSGGENSAAIANIHNNDEFELLEHISKISLTYPEIPIVLLLPEPIQPSLNWGSKVFALVKPVSAFAILKRLEFLNNTDFNYDGILKGGMLLSLLDHCIVEKKSSRITIDLHGLHSADLLIRKGHWVSLYLDDSLSNAKLLLPFAWDGALYKIEDTSNAEVGEFEITPAEYQKFRIELQAWLSNTAQLPGPLSILSYNVDGLQKLSKDAPYDLSKITLLLDGTNDLFDLFLNTDLKLVDAGKQLSYMNSSSILNIKDSPFIEDSQKILNKEDSDTRDNKKRRSKELGVWIMDPLNAAKKLGEKLKEDVKSNRKEPTQKHFRPRRRTQPGLGKLINLLSKKDDNSVEEVEIKWDDTDYDRSNAHDFAKSFAKASGEFSNLENESIPIPFNEQVTKKLEHKKGNEQSELSGSFKLSLNEDGSIGSIEKEYSVENVKKEVDKAIGGVPAIVIDDSTDVVVEQDYEKIALQSGVIEFDWKNRVSSGEEPSVENTSESIISEIGKISNLEKRETPIVSNPLKINPDEHISSLNELQDLRKKRKDKNDYGYGDEVGEEERERLNSKYINIINTIKKDSIDGENVDSHDDKSKDTNDLNGYEPYVEDEEDEEDYDYDDDSGYKLSISDEDISTNRKKQEIETFEKKSADGFGVNKIVIGVILTALIIIGSVVWTRMNKNSGKTKTYDKSKKIKKRPLVVKNVKKIDPPMKKPLKKVSKKIDPPKIAPKKPVDNSKTIEKNNFIEKINGLYAKYKVKKSSKTYKKIKTLTSKSGFFIPQLMEKVALVAYDQNDIGFSFKIARKSVEIDKKLDEMWWLIAMIAYEKGNKKIRDKAFFNYFKLKPNNKKRRKLAKKTGFIFHK
jgi:hypothetical protein